MKKTPYELLHGRKPNIAYFWVFGCKCYIWKKGTRLSKFDKKCEKDSYLVHDVEFDETKGSQDENENLEDVRGIQLSNAMKNMDVGELRPRQVIDEEDDQV